MSLGELKLFREEIENLREEYSLIILLYNSDSNKYIFLPAGGEWQATDNDMVVTSGYYNSSTLYVRLQDIWHIRSSFYTLDVSTTGWSYFGRSIHPIS